MIRNKLGVEWGAEEVLFSAVQPAIPSAKLNTRKSLKRSHGSIFPYPRGIYLYPCDPEQARAARTLSGQDTRPWSSGAGGGAGGCGAGRWRAGGGSAAPQGRPEGVGGSVVAPAVLLPPEPRRVRERCTRACSGFRATSRGSSSEPQEVKSSFQGWRREGSTETGCAGRGFS